VTGTGPCERPHPPTPNTHTHTHTHTHTQRCTHRQSWASLLVTALMEKKKERKKGMVGVRNEIKKGKEERQDRQHKCTVIGHTVKHMLQ